MPSSADVPLPLKIAYTSFVLVLVPVYWSEYGAGNFLWFSDVMLFAVGAVLWTGFRLLLSMMAVGVLAVELGWNVEFFWHLLTGQSLFGLSSYMFDPSYSLLVRGLSLFHVFVPAVTIWLLRKWCYDTRALRWQTVFGSVVLALTFLLTEPDRNINWVFGPGEPQQTVPGVVYLIGLMTFLSLGLYVPSHLILKRVFPCPTPVARDP